MKRTMFSILIMAILGVSITAQSATNKAPSPKTNWQATFVELGSVNCAPCRMMQPVMKEIEEKYGGTVKVIFYDVWTPQDRDKAVQYGIRVIPTQIFLDKDGIEFFRHIGFFSAEEIGKLLASKDINPTGKKDREK